MCGELAGRLGAVALAAALSVLIAGVARAQAPFDAAAYRNAKALSTVTFLDRTKPTAARLAAADRLRYPEESTFTALLVVLADRREPDEIRLKAAEHCRYDDKYIDSALTILAELPNGGEALKAGLIYQIMRRTTFRQPAQLRQRIQAAIRDRLPDKAPKVRLAAYQTLVASHDATAITQLVNAVRSGRNLPIPLREALELLDIDGPTKHIVTVRPYLNHADPAVQAQAVRLLATDRESRATIVKLVMNPDAPQLVRTNGLRALAREDETFDYAIDIAADARQSAEVRYTAMKAFAGRMNYKRVPADSQGRFAQVVQKISTEQGLKSVDGNDVAVEAKELLEYLQRTFPAVRKSSAVP